jgi:tRNA(Arg) A34 adenosine deaminase TadA
MKNNILDLAIKIAKKTNTKQYNFVSIITNKKGKIISIGMNSYSKTHPLQAKYANLTNQPEKMYLHSEIAALTRLPLDTIPYAIYTARVDKSGNIHPAQPCMICRIALHASGVFKVYTT